MSYILASQTIRAPKAVHESNLTQFAQQKTLSGAVGRDYFGSNKRVWTLSYTNVNQTDYNIIRTIYLAYLGSATPQVFTSTESNYPVNNANVHLDFLDRDFNVSGIDYLSDFDLILTEA